MPGDVIIPQLPPIYFFNTVLKHAALSAGPVVRRKDTAGITAGSGPDRDLYL